MAERDTRARPFPRGFEPTSLTVVARAQAAFVLLLTTISEKCRMQPSSWVRSCWLLWGHHNSLGSIWSVFPGFKSESVGLPTHFPNSIVQRGLVCLGGGFGGSGRTCACAAETVPAAKCWRGPQGCDPNYFMPGLEHAKRRRLTGPKGCLGAQENTNQEPPKWTRTPFAPKVPPVQRQAPSGTDLVTVCKVEHLWLEPLNRLPALAAYVEHV